jgi:uncharacterized membrane protein
VRRLELDIPRTLFDGTTVVMLDGTARPGDGIVPREAKNMDELLFHPKVVHLPIALAFLMPLFAGGVALAYLRGWLQWRTWVLVLLLQGSMLGSGLLAMKTGEAEEDRVEQVVAEQLIERHAEAAERFTWASALMLALMALPLILREGDLRNALIIFSCVGTVAVLALAYRVGDAGGKLVYKYGAASAYVSPTGGEPERLEAVEEYEYDVDSEE